MCFIFTSFLLFPALFHISVWYHTPSAWTFSFNILYISNILKRFYILSSFFKGIDILQNSRLPFFQYCKNVTPLSFELPNFCYCSYLCCFEYNLFFFRLWLLCGSCILSLSVSILLFVCLFDIYPAWVSLSFLDLGFDVSHYLGKILGHFLFKYFFYPFYLFLLGFQLPVIRLLNTIQQLLNVLFCFHSFSLCVSIWIFKK